MNLPICRTVTDLRATVSQWHAAGEKVAVVPTMGALHEGHLSLVRAARGRATRVIVTLFVNPRQFNNADDLAKYPRDEEADRAKLASENVDLLFAPGVEEMYPEGFSTTVSVAGLSEGLCGAHRPGHFDGVATVVTKLLLQTQVDVALFGEKDYQQLSVIRRLVRDLDIPVEVVGVPTVREADGLALSSRNVRLSAEGRRKAPALAEALATAGMAIERGEDADAAIARAKAAIKRAGYSEVEYLELRDAETLEPVSRAKRPARLLVAAWLDSVRLIDNLPVLPPSHG
ncbi:pantoate--beta-alanine ligase [Pelagibacterium sp. 26DY04]|uniref:pantoate--beta-alanine ligase n=1 Tax=Pelagibacterium sp. 26DY04 TaxID=2967130 RepID=UPI00281540B8|nr:pantoate--beta-alanine ligase [Pelagibacterium sp. 26DY04]WMT85441.1 pantoate--beta-alanine ligase [Pelagibacterium sp. 26DY04]